MSKRVILFAVVLFSIAFFSVVVLVWEVLDLREALRLERAHVRACREVVDGEYLLPGCNCGTPTDLDESILASCRRSEYAHYEILQRGREISRGPETQAPSPRPTGP